MNLDDFLLIYGVSHKLVETLAYSIITSPSNRVGTWWSFVYRAMPLMNWNEVALYIKQDPRDFEDLILIKYNGLLTYHPRLSDTLSKELTEIAHGKNLLPL